MLDMLFEGNALLFTMPAVLGTAVFLIKLGLMAIGAGADGDIEIEIDADVDTDLGDSDADSTHAFNVLSVQSIACFMMGFGWGGLGGLIGLDWAIGPSLALGAGIGAAMVYLLGLLLKGMYDLQTSGNVDARDAIGAEGIVYVGIPGRTAGTGQVRVVVDERARIYNAETEGEPIATRTRVRVTRVNEDNTLTVAPA